MGWANAKEKFTITASWLDESMKIEADKGGNWRIEVKTKNSKEPQTIRLHNETSNITLENVLFGEVWLCSGQPNMGMQIKGKLG